MNGRLIFILAVCVFLVWLVPGCANSGRAGTAETQVVRTVQSAPSSQPADVSQDVAGLIAKLSAKVDDLIDITATVNTEVGVIKKTTFTKNTYGDVSLIGGVVVVAFLMFVASLFYANRQARKHGYWEQRRYRKMQGDLG